MANAELEVKEKAAVAARAKAEQAKAEAEQATAELDQAIAQADQEAKEKAAEAAKAKAEQARAEAEQAQAKGAPDLEAKKTEAEAANTKAEQAKTEAEAAKTRAAQAKTNAEAAKTRAAQAKTIAGQAIAEAEQAKAEAVRLLPGMAQTPPPGLNLQTFMQHADKLTGLFTKVLLALIVAFFLGMIIYNFREGGTLLNKLSDPKVTRGFITFLISLGTIAIAVMLVIAAFASDGGNDNATLKERDESLKERFTMGKEVLTALIGILGTIVGFYFGAAEKGTALPISPAGEVRVSNPEPKQGDSFDITFAVKDGEPPYTYSITFPPNTLQSVKDQTSQSKEIKATIKVPEDLKPDTEVIPQNIKVSDKNNNSITIEKNLPKIVVKERPIGKVSASNPEPKQGDSFDITFTVKVGEPPYTYSITFPPNTLHSVKDQTSQSKEIKATIKVPEDLKPDTEVIPQKIEVTDKNKKSITLEKNLPKIVVKEKGRPAP